METNTGAASTKRYRFKGIKIKFALGMTLIVVLITLSAILVGAQTYWFATTSHYNTVGFQTARATEGYFEKGELKFYGEMLMNYRNGKLSEDELKVIGESERYSELYNLIDKLRVSMEVNDIYIGVIDMDMYNCYTEKSMNDGTWKPMLYIMDSYYVVEEKFNFGDSSKLNPKYREVVSGVYRTGKITDTLLLSKYQEDYTLTAFYPVIEDGNTVAAIGVEIPMKSLNRDISSFVIMVVIIAGALSVILLVIGIMFISRTMIRPIIIVTEEAEKFAENNAEISDKLDKIRTKDEIQLLSQSVLSLEIDIKDYIENITKITAEKERISAELNVATQIQADMLPSIFPPFPERTEFDIYATMTPAKEVGGDFYDFFLIDDDHIALVMADVSGKGVPAALFMVIAKTLIKNHAQLGELSPAKVLMQANDQLCEGNEAELFVTVWLAIIEISTGKGKAANAGHEHPTLRRKDGKYELVEYRHSPAVATMEGIRFKEHEFELFPGDSLFVYTDGVAEATNAGNELFGTERMLDALNKDPGAAPKEILANVKKAVDEFVGTAPQFDDITMLGFVYYGSDNKPE